MSAESGRHHISPCVCMISAVKVACYRRLGEKLCDLPPPSATRQPLLRDVWRVISGYTCLPDYLHVADIWVEFTLRHFGIADLDKVLADVRKHVGTEPVSEGYSPIATCSVCQLVHLNADIESCMRRSTESLSSLTCRVLSHHSGAAAAMQLPNFVPLLDAFPVVRSSSAGGRACSRRRMASWSHYLFSSRSRVHVIVRTFCEECWPASPAQGCPN